MARQLTVEGSLCIILLFAFGLGFAVSLIRINARLRFGTGVGVFFLDFAVGLDKFFVLREYTSLPIAAFLHQWGAERKRTKDLSSPKAKIGRDFSLAYLQEYN